MQGCCIKKSTEEIVAIAPAAPNVLVCVLYAKFSKNKAGQHGTHQCKYSTKQESVCANKSGGEISAYQYT